MAPIFLTALRVLDADDRRLLHYLINDAEMPILREASIVQIFCVLASHCQQSESLVTPRYQAISEMSGYVDFIVSEYIKFDLILQGRYSAQVLPCMLAPEHVFDVLTLNVPETIFEPDAERVIMHVSRLRPAAAED